METYVLEVAGEPVMAFRAEDEEEAQELVHGEESENGIKTTLLEYLREGGQPLWDGVSELTVRSATAEEHQEWQTSRDDAIEAGDDPDGFDAFLIPIIDPQEEDDCIAA